MSDVKQVNVILTPQDEKSFSRKAKASNKTRKADKAGKTAKAVKAVKAEKEEIEEKTVQHSEDVPEPIKEVVAVQKEIPIEPKKEPEKTKLQIKIQSKKGSVAKTILPKIIPHKKKSSAPIPIVHTVKHKPKLIIPPRPKIKSSPKSPGGTRGDSASVKSAESSKHSHKPIIRKKEKLQHKKKRFTERKISIEMAPFSTTRKHRVNLKKKLETMPIAFVKAMLVEKGALKTDKTNLPDIMLRSMLHDYLSLHTVE